MSYSHDPHGSLLFIYNFTLESSKNLDTNARRFINDVDPQLLVSKVSYARRRPENTFLYKLIQENLLSFYQQLELEQGSGLPEFVKKEFSEFLKCGILAHDFLRAKCE
ncbi:MAG: hypothetical protein H6625_02715 [Bdellovibrionaceae bacterium]|nr:hypothetical protein [Pseudobdellovibrionaceae bacterium]